MGGSFGIKKVTYIYELQATLMKQLLTILTLCLTTISYSQTTHDIQYFYSAKKDDDSAFKYFMSILNKFDSTDKYKNFYCDKASERVGDYYKSRNDYLKAIAYYDSADTKYRDKLQSHGNGYYIDFIPRRFKESQCYSGLSDPKKALSVLTPYIFDSLGSSYFDSTMISYYVSTLHLIYSKREIQAELKKAIDNIDYSNYYRWAPDSSAKYLNVSCKLKLFGTEIELAGFETSAEKDNGIPFNATKDFFMTQFKELEIYKRLHN